MATLTLEYNARNSVANRIIDIITAMDNVFKVKTSVKTNTHKAIQDVEKGNVITCDSYEDYLRNTANMLKISYTNQYLKDLELMKRRNIPKSELDEIVKLLSEEKTLLPKHKDHRLKGTFAGYRECHIRPGWLLIYK